MSYMPQASQGHTLNIHTPIVFFLHIFECVKRDMNKLQKPFPQYQIGYFLFVSEFYSVLVSDACGINISFFDY